MRLAGNGDSPPKTQRSPQGNAAGRAPGNTLPGDRLTPPRSPERAPSPARAAMSPGRGRDGGERSPLSGEGLPGAPTLRDHMVAVETLPGELRRPRRDGGAAG